MRKRVIYIALSFFIFFSAKGQYSFQWKKYFGNSALIEANSIDLLPSGNILIAGTLKENGTHAWLQKLSPDGKILWIHILNNHKTSVPVKILVLPDSSFIITGYIRDYEDTNDNVWLAKYNDKGILLWERSFYNLGFSRATDIAQSLDKGFIITANTSTESDPSNWLVIKTDSLGFIQWTRNSGSPYNDQLNAVAVLKNNTYATVGFITQNQGGQKIMAMSIYDSSGYEIAYQEFKTLGFSEAMDVIATSDSAIVIAGYSIDSITHNDLLIIKTDYNGDTIWLKKIKLPYREIPFSILEAFDKTYIVSYNLLTSEFPYSDIGILQISPQGKIIYSNLLRQFSDDFVAQLIENKDNSISILATNHTIADGWKISVTKCKSKLTTDLKFIIPKNTISATRHEQAIIQACISTYMKPKKLVILHNNQPIDTITKFNIIQDSKCQFSFETQIKLKYGINVITFELTDYKSYKIIRKRTIIYIPLPQKLW